MSNLTPEQLIAIKQYAMKLTEIDDPQTLRRHAVNNYRQNLAMHNTYLSLIDHYRSIINHHLMIDSESLGIAE